MRQKLIEMKGKLNKSTITVDKTSLEVYTN